MVEYVSYAVPSATLPARTRSVTSPKARSGSVESPSSGRVNDQLSPARERFAPRSSRRAAAAEGELPPTASVFVGGVTGELDHADQLGRSTPPPSRPDLLVVVEPLGDAQHDGSIALHKAVGMQADGATSPPGR